MEIPTWNWLLFGGVLFAFLAIDLYAHRGERHDSKRTAIVWSVIWIVVGLGFGGIVWWEFGGRPAADYLGAYLIEKSLSMDNLFVFLIIFKMLHIPRENQRTALSWGIFGALARLGLTSLDLIPAWVWWKLVLWVLLGAAPFVLRKKAGLAGIFWWLLPVLGAAAAWLALYKPV